jgi:uncharacterized protein
MGLPILTEATRVSSGGFADVVAFRIRELPGLLPLQFFMFLRTVALMLIGGRGIACRPVPDGNEGEQAPADGCRDRFGLRSGALSISRHRRASLRWQGQLSLERLGTVLLAFGYGAVIIWASDKAMARSWLA